MHMTRADRSRLADWWFTIDRSLYAAVLLLLVAGLVLSLAASPAVAVKKGLEPFYFFQRQAAFSVLALGLLFALSLMHPSSIRRLATGMLAVMLAGLVYALVAGEAVNGAQRWISIGGFSFQPSELMKPAFVIVAAWLFAETRLRPDMPAMALVATLGVMIVGLLVLQPDVGQAVLVAFVWGVLYLLSGQPVIGAVVLALMAICGLGLAYLTLPHVRGRIDAFLAPSPAENSQLDRAMQSFIEGGFFGRGPGEGTIKTRFPDAHTDFIYAVIAEEYGVIACLALLALFAFIVWRAFVRSFAESDAADRLAVQGLAVMFGTQALINMGVNVGLLPAKGMTLPYISAGGSSHLGITITLGMLLALTRRRAIASRIRPPRPMALDDDIVADGAAFRRVCETGGGLNSTGGLR